MSQSITNSPFSGQLDTSSKISSKIDRRLSNRGRISRILALGSLLFYLCDKNPTDEKLEEYNNKFKIVTRVDSLWVPALLNKFIWRKLNYIDILNNITNGKFSKKDAVELIISKVPKLLRYKNMEIDIENVLVYGISQI